MHAALRVVSQAPGLRHAPPRLARRCRDPQARTRGAQVERGAHARAVPGAVRCVAGLPAVAPVDAVPRAGARRRGGADRRALRLAGDLRRRLWRGAPQQQRRPRRAWHHRRGRSARACHRRGHRLRRGPLAPRRAGLLGAIAVALVVALALVVRNPFGVVFTLAVAGAAGWLAVRGSDATAQLGCVFLATQLALSVFSRADYLFTDTAVTGAGTMASDTAQMAQALGGTYWLWGLACGAFSLVTLAAGVAWFLRVLREPRRPR
ncbi:MAG: M50 family metallopeptidase [Nannocystaceae bacterium]